MIQYQSFSSVRTIQTMGSDAAVCMAARVSLGNDDPGKTTSRDTALIKYLMENRHGSPFEHALMTFRIETPIFVWRELMRHRIASYNEQSGRYMEMRPIFYVPHTDRPLQQVGKAGQYEMVAGTLEQGVQVPVHMMRAQSVAWEEYQSMLQLGVCREVARMVLPVSIFSAAYVTMNLRALMNFLSLRVDWGDAADVRSHPMFEIEEVAREMSEEFIAHFPLVADAFEKAGYRAP